MRLLLDVRWLCLERLSFLRGTLALYRLLEHNGSVNEAKSRGRRNSLRVPFGLRVEVLSGPQAISAEVMNISQKGYFLRPNEQTPADLLTLTTSLSATRPVYLVLQFLGEQVPLRAKGVVAWKSDLGVGINFQDPPERLRDFISDLQDSGTTSLLLSQVKSARVELE